MRRATRAERAAAGLVVTAALSAISARAAPSQAELVAQATRLEQDPSNGALVKDPTGRARRALDRAHAMDHAGDSGHAALLRAAAEGWLAMATDLIRAAAAEARARASEKELVDAETKVVRGRALLEETIARKGRAQAELDDLARAGRRPEATGIPAGAGSGAPGPGKPPTPKKVAK